MGTTHFAAGPILNRLRSIIQKIVRTVSVGGAERCPSECVSRAANTGSCERCSPMRAEDQSAGSKLTPDASARARTRATADEPDHPMARKARVDEQLAGSRQLRRTACRWLERGGSLAALQHGLGDMAIVMKQ